MSEVADRAERLLTGKYHSYAPELVEKLVEEVRRLEGDVAQMTGWWKAQRNRAAEREAERDALAARLATHTEPDGEMTEAFSVVLDELVVVEPDEGFTLEDVARSIVGMLSVAGLIASPDSDSPTCPRSDCHNGTIPATGRGEDGYDRCPDPCHSPDTDRSTDE